MSETHEIHTPAALAPAPTAAQWEQEWQLAAFDRLLTRLQQWSEEAPPVDVFQRAVALIQRLLPRLHQARLHLDDVLIVGVVGGTGTGKSTLINALVGERVSPVSAQRPTTARPQVLCREGTDIAFPDLDPDLLVIHRRPLPLLANMVLIDCPDPDTQPWDDPATSNRNRDVLRTIMPHCDVIIYVASQEKYKSRLVTDELLRHAPGCHIVFVQSKAQVDADIRDDWRKTLTEAGLHVSDIFRIDAEAVLQDQEQGNPVDPAFTRLKHLLEQQLAARARYRIKRANILDLYDWLFSRIDAELDQQRPVLERLERELLRHQDTWRSDMRAQLEHHLRTHRQAWRAKVIAHIQEQWSGGPFATLLRLFGGGSAYIRWLPLALSRSLPQLAVAGSLSTAASLRDFWQQQQATQALSAYGTLGLTEAEVMRVRRVLEGYAYEAGIESLLDHRMGPQREQAVAAALAEIAAHLQHRVDAALTASARRRVEQHAGPVMHGLMEIAFALLPALIAYQMGRSFFYDHLYAGEPYRLGLDYLLQALIWIAIWGWGLRGFLLWRLHRGLRQDIQHVANDVCTSAVLANLHEDIHQALNTVQRHRAAFAALRADLERLHQDVGTLELAGVGRRLS